MRQPGDNLTIAEALAILNESPHLKARLGKKGDSELSETTIYFRPRSMQSKTNTQKKETKPTFYYRVSPDNEGLVFTWKERAEYVSKIHEALKAKTWGELKKKLPSKEYEFIIEHRANWNRPIFKSSDPFDAYDHVPGYGDGDYPPWQQQEMFFYLPEEILDKYASVEDTMHNGEYYYIEQRHEEAICRDLRALGFNVVRRDDLYFY